MNWANRVRSLRLSPHNRKLLVVGSLVAVGLCGHFFVLLPAKEKMGRLDAAIAQRQQDHRALLVLRQEYAHVQEGLRLAERRVMRANAGTSLLTIVEELTSRHHVRGRVTHIRPQAEVVGEGFRETSVELKLEALRLDEVLKLTAAIDDSVYWLRVRRFHLKTRYSDPGLFDISLLLSTYVPLAQPARWFGGSEYAQ